MHIVHYWPRFDLQEGGVVRAAIDLVAALARGGVNVTLLTVDDRDIPAAWPSNDESSPTVVRLDGPLLRGRRLSNSALQHATQHVQHADVLHLHTPWELSNLQLANLARQCDVPYVASMHGMLDDWPMQQKPLKKRAFLTLFGKQFLRHAAAVHLTADGELKQAGKRLPDGRRCVIPLVVDLQPLLQPRSEEEMDQLRREFSLNDPIVLFLSRVHPKKSVETLIDAARLLQDRGHVFSLAVAGPGEPNYIESLRQRAADRNVTDHVRFLGMVNGDKKLALYHASAVFALPTQQENFGIVLAEALACGTPIVTTRGASIWPELQQAGAAIVQRTPDAFAEAIEPILSDLQKRQQLAAQGREYVSKWLDEENVTQQYREFYSQVSRGTLGSLI